MGLRRARTADEYADWVKSALFEVEDLKNCLFYETEDLQRLPAYIEPLETGVKRIYADMCAGCYTFGREDLVFMDVLRRYEDQIPFHTLLKQINETHRKGLEVDESSSCGGEIA